MGNYRGKSAANKRPENAAPQKPSRPDGFPLFAHATGRWAKKVRGKLHYFGPWEDREGALNRWLDQKDYLLAGRKPRRTGAEGEPTVRALLNRFLTDKKHMVDTGEIASRTLRDYIRTGELIVTEFGRDRLLSDLTAEDFSAFRTSLAIGRGPVALGNEIQRVRVIFKYAYDAELIPAPLRFGPTFRKPSQRVLRKARAAGGPRTFTAEELRATLDAAKNPLRAMILLGINCGFGQSDIASLPKSALDLDGGWVRFPRPKTEVDRRCPLWPETVAAVRDAITTRPRATDPADDGLAFMTKYGRRWVRTNDEGVQVDSVALEFGKVRTRLGSKDKRSFYALRRGFETIGGDSRDQIAVDFIMGHAPGSDDMAAIYRDAVFDDRLRAVAEHVHRWLFPPSDAGPDSTR